MFAIMFSRLKNDRCHARIKKVLLEGVQPFLYGDDPNTTKSGPSSARQHFNGISLACQ